MIDSGAQATGTSATAAASVSCRDIIIARICAASQLVDRNRGGFRVVHRVEARVSTTAKLRSRRAGHGTGKIRGGEFVPDGGKLLKMVGPGDFEHLRKALKPQSRSGSHR